MKCKIMIYTTSKPFVKTPSKLKIKVLTYDNGSLQIFSFFLDLF